MSKLPYRQIHLDFHTSDDVINVARDFDKEAFKAALKEAELDFSTLASLSTEKGERSLVKVKLKTGRFHQIRVQFASRGAPISGDGKYGSRDNGAKMPALFAYRLSFVLFGKKISAERLPDLSGYPWSLFDKEKYGEL